MEAVVVEEEAVVEARQSQMAVEHLVL